VAFLVFMLHLPIGLVFNLIEAVRNSPLPEWLSQTYLWSWGAWAILLVVALVSMAAARARPASHGD
jgi:hypothetical protein